MSFLTLLIFCLLLLIGNCIYQYFTKKDYEKALERSFFQSYALLMYQFFVLYIM